jgi:endoglucanase
VRAVNLLGGRVLFANGLQGTIGREKPKSNDEKPEVEKMFLDVGAPNKDALTVGIGDVACFYRPMADLGDRIMAKAMDDRIGCAVLVQTLQALEGSPHDVYAVFTVQEEVGLRGAITSAYGVAPDIGIAVDVTIASDTPQGAHLNMALGDGPCIKVKDGGMLAHPGVKRAMIEAAERLDIPYQLEVLLGGTTDAKAMQISQAGVAAGTVSIPTRYVHTPSEMVDYDDVQNSVRLLTGMLGGSLTI